MLLFMLDLVLLTILTSQGGHATLTNTGKGSELDIVLSGVKVIADIRSWQKELKITDFKVDSAKNLYKIQTDHLVGTDTVSKINIQPFGEYFVDGKLYTFSIQNFEKQKDGSCTFHATSDVRPPEWGEISKSDPKGFEFTDSQRQDIQKIVVKLTVTGLEKTLTAKDCELRGVARPPSLDVVGIRVPRKSFFGTIAGAEQDGIIENIRFTVDQIPRFQKPTRVSNHETFFYFSTLVIPNQGDKGFPVKLEQGGRILDKSLFRDVKIWTPSGYASNTEIQIPNYRNAHKNTKWKECLELNNTVSSGQSVPLREEYYYFQMN